MKLSKRICTSWSCSKSMYEYGCPLRIRNSLIIKVPEEHVDPKRTTSPMPDATSSTLRRKKARIIISKFCIALQQIHHILAVQLDNFTWFGGTYSNNGSAAREHIDLTGEFSRTMYSNKSLNGTRRAHNLKLTRKHYKKRKDVISLLD
jgi:hypothetical protein